MSKGEKMAYTKKFTRPYATYKDRPDKTTPVTAEIKNMESDAFESIEKYLADGIPSNDIQTNDGRQFTTWQEKEEWHAKYTKPNTGIPENDLSADVQEKLNSGGGGGGDVISVNGKKGIVVLSAEDVGALPEGTSIPQVDDSLEGQSGIDALSANQGRILNELKYEKPEDGIPEDDLSQEVQAKLNSGSSVTVIDNLTSDSSTDALSAKQGKVLKQTIEDASQGFTYDETESKLTFSGAIGGSGMHVYSDEEHVVGVWKVGGVEKPVYERCFIFTEKVISSDSSWIKTEFSSQGIDKIFGGFITYSDGGLFNAYFAKIDSKISIMTTRNGQCNFDVGSIMTLQYTKTTD